ncbi:MAG TPA: hypothetical protein PLJ47_01170 [Candidatus Hydrogenedentes bacterium]|nr:hypothetical protein [Candidatus Hydrogenedentota bacterium]HRK33175.1 hypothetical protein [Candidatus Hydrogenedentota bacterium]
MIVQCCVCQKVRKNDRWSRLAKPVNQNEMMVSHGYCPECAAEAFGDLYRRAQAREAARMTVVHAA